MMSAPWSTSGCIKSFLPSSAALSRSWSRPASVIGHRQHSCCQPRSSSPSVVLIAGARCVDPGTPPCSSLVASPLALLRQRKAGVRQRPVYSASVGPVSSVPSRHRGMGGRQSQSPLACKQSPPPLRRKRGCSGWRLAAGRRQRDWDLRTGALPVATSSSRKGTLNTPTHATTMRRRGNRLWWIMEKDNVVCIPAVTGCSGCPAACACVGAGVRVRGVWVWVWVWACGITPRTMQQACVFAWVGGGSGNTHTHM